MPWFYAKNKQQIGPVEDSEFDALVAAGTILPTDLVWQPGQPEWLPLAKVRAAVPEVLTPPSLPAAASPGAPAAAPTTAAPLRAEPLKGVAGWLLLFCVWLTIIGPLIRLFEWSSLLPYLLRGSVTMTLPLGLSLGVGLLMTVLSIVVGVLIWSGRPDGRRLAQLYLQIRAGVFAVMFAFNFLSLLLFRGMELYVLGRYVFNLLLEVAFLVIWWRYFQVSKRVQATYGEPGARG
ncbi:MAG: DUF4339 domain-containing protein [Verrucomicrobia bacterium]|nr:DUF4339 domain-containing protein [Verrucomicrobiota bacterium]